MMSSLASFWVWALTINLIIMLLYIIGTWTHKHFSKKNVPCLKPLPVFGNMGPLAFGTKSFPEFIADVYNKLKGHKYGGFYEFLKPVVVLRDPELIKMVTIKDFEHFLDHRNLITEDSEPLFGKALFNLQGPRWRHMRSTLSPAFTSSKMKNMFTLVSECGDQMGDFLHRCINDKTMKIESCKIQRADRRLEIEMKDLFTRYTNDVITTTALGIGCDSLKNPQNEFYTMGKKITTMGTLQRLVFLGYSLSPKLMKALKLRFISDKLSDYFRSLIQKTMDTRENKGIIRPDMIHLLMQAKKGTLKNEEDDDANGTPSIKPKLEDDDIISQAFIFFFAGFETVSTLMCFASHLLAVHPDIQTRLQKEIDQTLQENDGKVTYESVHSMKYLDMVLSETLRLYPPAVFMDRKCVKTYTLPTEPSYTLQPGEGIWIPVHGIHHDPEYFPDPEKFDPERFSDENKDKIKPFTYLPFGSGPRNCIGNRFALMESKIVLVHMLSRFNFKVVSRTPIPIKITRRGLNITVDGGFWLGLEERI
uniref:Cytochrome P450 9E1 n=1 Tax=Diploptera punctata TaxID=6984 RepID=Q6R7M3_DIPPU|nr:cytochrome P450 9E1 [Diploptera punctata]